MKIGEIESSQIWNQFFNKAGSPSFLQSWEWGEFQEGLEYRVKRLGIYNDKELEAIAQVIQINSKRGNFLFIPHGPIFMKHETYNIKHIKTIITQLLNYLIALAKNEGYSFIRIAPTLEDAPEYRKIFSDLGFKKAPIYMHAERLWVLPLVETHSYASLLPKTDDRLLSEMRKTTRYLIRKAQREGVIIEKRTGEKAVDDFWKIYQETARRENFVPFSKSFIEEEFNVFNKTGNALFLFGKVKNNVIPDLIRNPDKMDSRLRGNDNNTSYLASALIIFTKSTAFYHQGASIHTKIPVTYLLQWEAIKEAKKRGCQIYNFWGILQAGRSPKNWQGLTLFKTGFGGRQIDYLPTQDFVISRRYYLTYLYEKFLAWRRGV
ncbi:hypothetical protein A3A46_00040 [Candidatus Roizmanbacteria bacterium RIFCSPLOWO2_01_FULL_37_13]|uniref:BioF2-like acetyltransferase domain-containing protein n=1 Tax=Candidatus Roizmanbacteria bacterium RIFCSPHIGHO2_02_FULL_38_11 TaxID=1802039 RepID=A0A1F7H3W2_9BACT|nr:MAG: hypothetical protein A3C25_04615 [Candidatus Roizmanbacteria bacterium RIFCSPHIGHO2_02_FULL_38_11]OGK42934.1 MAG: hypothetical protein A3A46_00040 [Candidatus Roizmanbacteria bacterium RIFCSPLOWO2_01_FULL_37_13]